MADYSTMTTTSQVDPAVALFYDSVLLQPPTPEYIYGGRHVERAMIPGKSGNTYKWRKYSRLGVANVPVVEGQNPPAVRLVKTDITATPSQYASYTIITDVVDLTVEDPVITVAVDRQNDQMRNTDDQLARDYICSSATQTTCSNGSPTATLLNRTDIRGVTNTMRGDDIQYVTPMIKAGTGQGTAPIRSAYMAKADTDLENDLENVSGFKHVTNYAAQPGVEESEFGNTDNVRWITSSQGYISGSNYYNPFIGKVAGQFPVGHVEISGSTAKAIIKAFGSGGTEDPVNQRATVGWKMHQVYRILQELGVHVLIATNG